MDFFKWLVLSVTLLTPSLAVFNKISFIAAEKRILHLEEMILKHERAYRNSAERGIESSIRSLKYDISSLESDISSLKSNVSRLNLYTH